MQGHPHSPNKQMHTETQMMHAHLCQWVQWKRRKGLKVSWYLLLNSFCLTAYGHKVTLYSGAFPSVSLQVSPCPVRSLKAVRLHTPTDNTLMWMCVFVCWDVCLCTCGFYNLHTSLKWVFHLRCRWPDLSSICQFLLAMGERLRGRNT